MSYTSENSIHNTANIVRVNGTIEMLGYQKIKDGLKVPDRVGAYYWYDSMDFTYSDNKGRTLKEVKLTHLQLEQVIAKNQIIEKAIANSLSFQKPSIIAKNFKLIDKDIDIAGVLNKPYKNRKKLLFEYIEEYVLDRHKFVHSGEMNTNLFDKELNKLIDYFAVAARRVYEYFGEYYNFQPSDDY